VAIIAKRSPDGARNSAYPNGPNFQTGTAALGAFSWGTPSALEKLIVHTDGTYNFGTKANAKPFMYFDPELSNDLNSHNLSRYSDNLNIDNNYWTVDSVVKPTNALASAKVDLATVGTGAFYTTNFSTDGAGMQVIVFRRHRWLMDTTVAFADNSSWNIKDHRLWAGTSGGGQNNWVVALGQTTDADGNPRINSEALEQSQVSYLDSSHGLNSGEWVNDFYRIVQNTDPALTDGSIRFNRKGILASFIPAKTRDATTPDQLRRYVISQRQFGCNQAGHAFNLGYLYVDDSLHFCALSNQSEFEEISGDMHLEPQIPISWEPNRIVLSMRAGTLASFTGTSIHIGLSDGSRVPVVLTI